MKITKIYQPPSIRLKKMVAKKRGWQMTSDFRRLREDRFLQSRKFPIFAVADGVLMVVKPGEKYPVPSGAGEVAKIFCNSAVEQAEKIFEGFQNEDIRDVFAKANSKIERYNSRCGRTKKTINFFDFDYFCATAAFALIKNSELYWGSVGDSRVALADKNGKIKFASRDQVEPIEKLAARKISHPKPQEKKYFQQKYYRNKLGPKGELIGYGVIDGEKEALRYVEYGKAKIQKGEQLFIYTNGFTPYFKLPEFKKLFLKWPADIEERVSNFAREYVAKSLPRDPNDQYRFLYKYESEKSLIAVRF